MTKAEKTRQFIIERSADIINKKGMAGTSLNDIMEATKLAKGGIYGNFESKDEICLESFSYLSARLLHDLDKQICQGKTAKEKLFSLLDFYRSGSTPKGGCPMLNFGLEADDTHPVMRQRVQKAILAAQRRISQVIAAGVASKELSPQINPKNFSIKVFALIEGGILCRRVLGSNEQMNILISSIKKEFETYLN